MLIICIIVLLFLFELSFNLNRLTFSAQPHGNRSQLYELCTKLSLSMQGDFCNCSTNQGEAKVNPVQMRM